MKPVALAFALTGMVGLAATAMADTPTSLPAQPVPPASAAKLEVPQAGAPMPAFTVERWVNSPPLTPAQLRGKVVLVDFWEYTCVNCIRTLPFVEAWSQRYADAGLVIVGIHAPEFDFGKRAENIDRGIKDHGLTYPIALDNDFATWTAYNNNAWPAKYLFDSDGHLHDFWLGEGSYDQIEEEIRQLLTAAHPGVKLPPVTDLVAHYSEDYAGRTGLTGETYLGTARRQEGAFMLGGDWLAADEFIEHKGDADAEIRLTVTAGEVNLVMQPGPSGKASVAVMLDGKPIPAEAAGADVKDGVAHFDRSGMIRLVAHAGKREHKLVLTTKDPGVRAFAFTFGP